MCLAKSCIPSVGDYQSIDLIRLLDALGPAEIGEENWLKIRNARNEWAVFSLDRLRELSPRIVVGLDGESNLFRATDLYHTRRRYSWVDVEAKRIDMARPLGAFLYFPGGDPARTKAAELSGVMH